MAGGRPGRLRRQGACVPLLHRAAASPQDRVRPYQQAKTVQHLAGQRCEYCGKQGPPLRSELHFLPTELLFQDGDLVAQGKELGTLDAVTRRGQPQLPGRAIREAACLASPFRLGCG